MAQQFKYAGVGLDGVAASGTISAESMSEARSQLRSQEITGLTIKPKKSILQFEISKKKVKGRDVMHFTRQMSAFIKAGVPILDALTTLRDETDDKRFRTVLSEIIESIRGGATFSAAVANHADVFPVYYVGMVESAELSGNLDSVMGQIANYMDREQEAKRKVKGAMMYPAVVLVVALATVLVLTVFVLPRFEVFFKQLNATLPAPTRILLNISAFIGKWWWAFLLFFAFVALVLWLVAKTEKGAYKRDQSYLRLPAFGAVLRYALIERFCSVMASMSTAGVPLPQAMAVTADTTGNRVYSQGISRARSQMMEGAGLSRPIADTKLFPGTVTQMIRVGEETGTLDEQLGNAAEFYERELDYKIKGLTAAIEPAILIFVGFVVGFVAIALVSAMYGIFRQNI